MTLSSLNIQAINNNAIVNKVQNTYANNFKSHFFNLDFTLLTNMTDSLQNVNRFKLSNNKNTYVYMLNLAPYDASGINVCLHAKRCIKICIGKLDIKSTEHKRRLLRTILFLEHPQLFFEKLADEIDAIVKKKKDFVIRLNGYSDIEWEQIKIQLSPLIRQYKLKNNVMSITSLNIFELFPNVHFYDYTKYPNRVIQNYPNYHLTYSYDKGNANSHNLRAVSKNISVIVTKKLKNQLLGVQFRKTNVLHHMIYKNKHYTLINGDNYDNRFLDKQYPNRVIVLLEFQNITKGKIPTSRYAIDNVNKFNNAILAKM